MSEPEKKSPVFVSGMYFKGPDDRTKEKAPWVKGHVSIKMSDFKAFIEENKNEEWLNIDLKKSKGGKLYFELNTWKPSEDQKAEVKQALSSEPIVYPTEDITPEDIPF